MNNLKKYYNSIVSHLSNTTLPPEIRLTLMGSIVISVATILLWFFPTILYFLIGVAVFLFVSFFVGFLIELVITTWKNLREDMNNDQYRVD